MINIKCDKNNKTVSDFIDRFESTARQYNLYSNTGKCSYELIRSLFHRAVVKSTPELVSTDCIEESITGKSVSYDGIKKVVLPVGPKPHSSSSNAQLNPNVLFAPIDQCTRCGLTGRLTRAKAQKRRVTTLSEQAIRQRRKRRFKNEGNRADETKKSAS